MRQRKPTQYWPEIVDVWFTTYNGYFGNDPTFNGPATRSLKMIAERLQTLSESKGHTWNKEKAISTFSRFLSLAYQDQWLQKNYLLNVLYGKFDSIIARGKQPARIGSGATSANINQAFDQFYRKGQSN